MTEWFDADNAEYWSDNRAYPYRLVDTDDRLECLLCGVVTAELAEHWSTVHPELTAEWRALEDAAYPDDGAQIAAEDAWCAAHEMCAAPKPVGIPYASAYIDSDVGYHVVCPVCGFVALPKGDATTEDEVTKGAALAYAVHYQDTHA